MANNWLMFSGSLDVETPEEKAWLEEQLEFPSEVALEANTAMLNAPRFLREYGDHPEIHDSVGLVPEDGCAGFEWSWHQGEDGTNYFLWFHTDESGNPEAVAYLVHLFLAKFHPDRCWSLAFAVGCDKPRIDEFGGGALFVTAKDIQWVSTYAWIEEKRKAFEEAQEGANRGKK